VYTHPTATNPSLTPDLTGANVLATFETDAEGHVDVLTTRVLTLADLGYTGDPNANNYAHPQDGVDLGAALSGATVISDVEVNAEGHVTGFATRALTPTDIGAAVINDATTNTTETWSSDKISTEIANAVTAGMAYKGGYDAGANTPDLDTAPSGVQVGDTYTVTVAGTFFTTEVQVGDVLIAEADNASTEAEWTIVNKNIPDIVPASESESGIIQIATQAEVDAGTDDTKAVTPAKLESRLNGLDVGAEKYVETIGDGATTTFTITHSLGTQDVQVTLREAATNNAVGHASTAPTVNTVSLTFNTAPTTNEYIVTVVG
jgi:hypothetical protein